MSKMLTSVARMIRTGGMRGYTARAKTILKREANRSERHAPLGLEEYGTEEDDARMDVPHPDDVKCTFCGSFSASHRVVYIKQREPTFCDCCENFEWAPFCKDCTS